MSIYKWTRLEQGGRQTEYPSTPVLHIKKAGTYQCVVYYEEQQQKSHLFVVKCLPGDDNRIKPKHTQTSFQLISSKTQYNFNLYAATYFCLAWAKYTGAGRLTKLICNSAFSAY